MQISTTSSVGLCQFHSVRTALSVSSVVKVLLFHAVRTGRLFSCHKFSVNPVRYSGVNDESVVDLLGHILFNVNALWSLWPCLRPVRVSHNSISKEV